MGTRGFVGFVVDGAEKIAYNHFDSYPSGVGIEVLRWLRQMVEHEDALGVEGLRLRASQVKVVDDDTPITQEAIDACRTYTDTNVGARIGADGKIDDSLNWYQLLRHTQGSPGAILDCGYLEDGSGFPMDSLFCEWGYLIDLDAMVFQVYRGFQHSFPKEGRWAKRPTKQEMEEDHIAHWEWCRKNDRQPWLPRVPEYKAVELVGEWPLSGLPNDEAFLVLEKREEEYAE